MKNEKNILKQNSLASGIIIKLGVGVALLAVYCLFVQQLGLSLFEVAGVYILIRSVLKVIRLAVDVLFSLLAIASLVILITIVTVCIF